MITDSGKIERIWQDFANIHVLVLNDSVQNYGYAQKKSYTVSEKHGGNLIQYEYRFYPAALTNLYPLDLIKKANRFVISSTTDYESDIDLKIYKSSWIRRLKYGDRYIVKSSKPIEFDKVLNDNLLKAFKGFPDLIVELSPDLDLLAKGNTLTLRTHNLPEELDEIESLRELFILIQDNFSDKF